MSPKPDSVNVAAVLSAKVSFLFQGASMGRPRLQRPIVGARLRCPDNSCSKSLRSVVNVAGGCNQSASGAALIRPVPQSRRVDSATRISIRRFFVKSTRQIVAKLSWRSWASEISGPDPEGQWEEIGATSRAKGFYRAMWGQDMAPIRLGARGGLGVVGLHEPALALQGYTGRAPNAVAKAAHDPFRKSRSKPTTATLHFSITWSARTSPA